MCRLIFRPLPAKTVYPVLLSGVCWKYFQSNIYYMKNSRHKFHTLHTHLKTCHFIFFILIWLKNVEFGLISCWKCHFWSLAWLWLDPSSSQVRSTLHSISIERICNSRVRLTPLDSQLERICNPRAPLKRDGSPNVRSSSTRANVIILGFAPFHYKYECFFIHFASSTIFVAAKICLEREGSSLWYF